MGSPTALCPAADQLAGPPIGGPSILCGVLRREAVDDRITIGRISPLITALHDPSIFFGFCCGHDVPAWDGQVDSRGTLPKHYTSCSIWQEEKQRIAEERKRAWTPIDRYTQPVDEEDWLERTRG